MSELLHQRVGNRVEVRQDDMTAGGFRELPWCPRLGLSSHPRSIKELDEGKGEQDEQEHHARKKDDN